MTLRVVDANGVVHCGTHGVCTLRCGREYSGSRTYERAPGRLVEYMTQVWSFPTCVPCVVRALRGENMMSQRRVLSFVCSRIDAMAARPRMWAGSQESFILLLMQLVELTYVAKNEKWASRRAALNEMCGPESGCTVPCGPIVDEWAKATCDVARRHLRRGIW